MAGLYKTQTADDITIKEPGFVKAWVTPVPDFDTLSEPILSDPELIGEANRIDTDHVWQTGKEAILLYADPDTMDAPGKSSGEVESLSMLYEPLVYIIGDGPIVKSIVDSLRNGRHILHLQNECDSDPNYIQFGCKCDPAKITEVLNITGQKLAGGKVGYSLKFRSYCKTFYYGAIVERT